MLIGVTGCAADTGSEKTAKTPVNPSSPTVVQSSTPGTDRVLKASSPTPPALQGTATSGAGKADPHAQSAQVGRPGNTQQVTFAPTRITVSQNSSSSSAAIVPVDTERSGNLAIPPDSARIGWWRSGALAGDSFGSVVLAGHVDTARYGIGYFARLLKTENGDLIRLSDGSHEVRYRVTSVREVPKNILSSSTDTFSQRGPGRLVLLTCTGSFDKALGHYDRNLVVTANPIG